MRPIDADALLQRVERWRDMICDIYGKNDEYADCLAEVVMKIEDAPTIDVPERKVGEWIITEHHSNYDDWDDYTCPFCRKTFSRIYGARFCPSCGAKLFDKDTNVPGKGEDDATGRC